MMSEINKVKRIGENLELVHKRRATLSDVSDCQIYELASAFADCDVDALRSVYAEITGQNYISGQFALLCKEYSRLGKKNRRNSISNLSLFLHIYGNEDYSAAPNMIAYLKNSYSDVAYSRLSRQHAGAKSLFVQSFSSACEEVYYGRARFCILPMQNTVDGRLTAFKKLVDKFDLKITCATDVNMADGESSTRFALLERDIKLEDKKYDYLELSFPMDVSKQLPQFVEGLKVLGAGIESMSITPHAYSDTESIINAVLNIKNSEVYPLLMYLHYAVITNVPVGIYKVV